MASATKKRKQTNLPMAQFIAIIVLSISVFLVIDFGRRAANGYRIRREEARLQAELQSALEVQQILVARREHVKTDSYVESVARTELNWSRPSETVVVIMPTLEAPKLSPASVTFGTVSDQPDTPLQGWLNLFFPELRLFRFLNDPKTQNQG